MKYITMILALGVATAGPSTVADETTIFSDSFATPELSSAWTVHKGEWTIEDGALVNRAGGLVTLNAPPGGRYTLEADIYLPGRWFSLITQFTNPESYSTLYFFCNGYWESFVMVGKDIADYIQHKDPDITTGKFHKIKVVSDYGVASLYYDGTFKGDTVFDYRPGSRVGFHMIEKGGLLKIKNLRITKTDPGDAEVVQTVPSQSLAKGVIWKDHGQEGKSSPGDRLALDADAGVAGVAYAFAPSDVFESTFVRIPLNAGTCNTVFMDMEGDDSQNNAFVILHDASGEQHLVIKTSLAWQGWQDVGINLRPFLESPADMERRGTHWHGDRNQRIDFPIRAIDVGVAKSDKRVKDSGQFGFRNVRFTK